MKEKRSKGVGCCMAIEWRCGVDAEGSQDADAESCVGSSGSGDLLFSHHSHPLSLPTRR